MVRHPTAKGPLALNPLAVFGAMGDAGQRMSAKIAGPESPPRPSTSKSTGRPSTGKSQRSGGSAMEMVDRLVEEMPVDEQEGCIHSLSILPPHYRRTFVEVLLDHVTEEKPRIRAFHCVASLLAQDTDDPGRACGPLIQAFRDDPAEAGYIVDLHSEFPEHRWRELAELPMPQRTALLGFFHEMTRAERKRVGRACGGLLPMAKVLELMRDLPGPHCPHCRVKRAHRDQQVAAWRLCARRGSCRKTPRRASGKRRRKSDVRTAQHRSTPGTPAGSAPAALWGTRAPRRPRSGPRPAF